MRKLAAAVFVAGLLIVVGGYAYTAYEVDHMRRVAADTTGADESPARSARYRERLRVRDVPSATPSLIVGAMVSAYGLALYLVLHAAGPPRRDSPH
jgi:hypothetical protein